MSFSDSFVPNTGSPEGPPTGPEETPSYEAPTQQDGFGESSAPDSADMDSMLDATAPEEGNFDPWEDEPEDGNQEELQAVWEHDPFAERPEKKTVAPVVEVNEEVAPVADVQEAPAVESFDPRVEMEALRQSLAQAQQQIAQYQQQPPQQQAPQQQQPPQNQTTQTGYDFTPAPSVEQQFSFPPVSPQILDGIANENPQIAGQYLSELASSIANATRQQVTQERQAERAADRAEMRNILQQEFQTREIRQSISMKEQQFYSEFPQFAQPNTQWAVNAAHKSMLQQYGQNMPWTAEVRQVLGHRVTAMLGGVPQAPATQARPTQQEAFARPGGTVPLGTQQAQRSVNTPQPVLNKQQQAMNSMLERDEQGYWPGDVGYQGKRSGGF